MSSTFLQDIKWHFNYYKILGDKTLSRLTSEQMLWQYNEESNSIAIIVKHLWGNMLSRWTDFLSSDGEKLWRKRDKEFISEVLSKEELIQKWEDGWACLFTALDSLNDEDMTKEILIRNEHLSVMHAIHRQLAHYAYHTGQIVLLGKMICNEKWESLSIPKINIQ
ncbi:MAG: DUF1572 domain-containing protein [Bacteroidota bacterium]|nr:DUF1572 domain-containing protein [Bacteroidota bacterium]